MPNLIEKAVRLILPANSFFSPKGPKNSLVSPALLGITHQNLHRNILTSPGDKDREKGETDKRESAVTQNQDISILKLRDGLYGRTWGFWATDMTLKAVWLITPLSL